MTDITPQDIKQLIINPELMGNDCEFHHFYIGKISGKTVVVLVEMTDDKHGNVICASWMHTTEELMLVNAIENN